MRTEHIFVIAAASELRVRFWASKTGLKAPYFSDIFLSKKSLID